MKPNALTYFTSARSECCLLICVPGFVAEGNKWNEANLILSLPDGDPLQALKMNIVGGFTDQTWVSVQIPLDYEMAETQVCRHVRLGVCI
jgi:hypothetical protein